MSKTVNFEKAQKPVILASGYRITHTTDDGKTIAFDLNGEETVTTICPQCGKAHHMTLGVFFELVGTEFDLYGTSVYCSPCSAKRLVERERESPPSPIIHKGAKDR